MKFQKKNNAEKNLKENKNALQDMAGSTQDLPKTRKLLKLGIGLCLLVCFDQLTKWFAAESLKNAEPVRLWHGVFELHYLENGGSAFGMLQGQRVFFLLIAAAMLLVVPYLYCRIPSSRRFFLLRVIAVLFLGGAAGNAIDRVLHGYVVDFFYFILIDFPIFNVADIYVTVSAALLIWSFLFYYKDEELEGVFPKKTKASDRR